MRYDRKQTLTVSEDDSTQPKSIRFQEKEQSIVDTSLNEVKTGDIDLPTNLNYDIPMGAIGTGKWFYLKSDKKIGISLSGGQQINLAAEKAHEMWADFSSLMIITSDTTRLTYAIGGEQ